MEILVIAAFTPNSPNVAKGPFCESCYESLLELSNYLDSKNLPTLSKAKLVSLDVIDELTCISCGGKIVKLVDGELEIMYDRSPYEVVRV